MSDKPDTIQIRREGERWRVSVIKDGREVNWYYVDTDPFVVGVVRKQMERLK